MEFKKYITNFNFKEYRFDSGNDEINYFLFTLSSNYINQKYSQIYLLSDENLKQIIGFFSLSCSQIEFDKEIISTDINLRYIPSLLIGQLAIDKQYQNRKFGTYLLTKAMELGAKISKDVGCRTLIVDAVANLNIINFYRKLNFKFVKKSVGVKILKDLREISSSEYKTVKMFFDLNDII